MVALIVLTLAITARLTVSDGLSGVNTNVTQSGHKSRETITLCSTSQSQKNKTAPDKESGKDPVKDSLVAALAARIDTQEAQMASLMARMASYDAKETACNQFKEARQQIMQDIQALKERRSNVSFLAVHTTSQDVLPQDFVRFLTVRHNVSPPKYGYDKHVGRFRCPVNGTYSFYFTTRTNQCGQTFRFGIVRDATVLSATEASTASSYCHALSMSAAAVTPCTRGDVVYVKNLQSSSRTIASDSDGITHFTGYLITQ